MKNKKSIFLTAILLLSGFLSSACIDEQGNIVSIPTINITGSDNVLTISNQTNLSSSRSRNVVYVNNYNYPLFVAVSLSSNLTASFGYAYTSPNNTSFTKVGMAAGYPTAGTWDGKQLKFIVLPGWYYSVNSSQYTIDTWIEWY